MAKVGRPLMYETPEEMPKGFQIDQDSRVGTVRRPSKKDLEYKKNPRLKEEEEAMEETLEGVLDD